MIAGHTEANEQRIALYHKIVKKLGSGGAIFKIMHLVNLDWKKQAPGDAQEGGRVGGLWRRETWKEE